MTPTQLQALRLMAGTRQDEEERLLRRRGFTLMPPPGTVDGGTDFGGYDTRAIPWRGQLGVYDRFPWMDVTRPLGQAKPYVRPWEADLEYHITPYGAFPRRRKIVA